MTVPRSSPEPNSGGTETGARAHEPPITEVPGRAWRVLAISAAGVFVVFLDATVVNIAFPALSADFPDVSRAGLSWVLNAYAVVFGALLVTAGRLADDRGRKRIFLTGLAVFAAGSALCGLAPSVPLLVAFRAVQAIGAALLVPASLALLLPEFPAARRAGAVGLWGAAGGAAAAAGPTLGALLVEGPGWRWIFLINVPFCVVAILVGRRVLRESTGAPAQGHQDLLGVVMVTAVFGLLSLGLVQGDDWGWTSWRVAASFAVALLLVPLLVRRALRHPRPALPVRLFAVRTFSVATAALLLFSAAFFAVILCNVLFLTEVGEFSVLRTAVALLPSPLLAAALSPVTGRLADRWGFRVLVVPGALSMAVGTTFLALRADSEVSYWTDFFPATVLIGVAIGCALPTLGAAGAASLLPHQFGAGSAVGATARQLGAVIGVAVLIAVLGEPPPSEALDSFRRAWLAIAATALACALLSLGVAGRRERGRAGL